jgi:hypothetical protein
MLCPTYILEFSSILHVALLVFLRLMTIRNSLSNGHEKYRLPFLVSIWMISIVPNLIRSVALIFMRKDIFVYLGIINFISIGTFPVIGIVIMYILLVHSVKKKKGPNKDVLTSNITPITESNNRRMTVIVMRLVIMLLICYIPYLANKLYFYGSVLNRASQKLTLEVNITCSQYIA